MRAITILLFFVALVQSKHYLLYSKPANELYKYDSYFSSKHFHSADFAMPLRNITVIKRLNSSM